jgi:hypothetical protein
MAMSGRQHAAAGAEGLAPGVVRIRLSGSSADVAAVADALGGTGIVLERSRPYPNRRDPGERVYLTVQIPAGAPAGQSLPPGGPR